MPHVEDINLLKDKLHRIGWDDRLEKYGTEIVAIKQADRNKRSSLEASIVIISCNISEETIETLKKLRKQEAHFEIIFVDNGSQTEHGSSVLNLSDTCINLRRNTGAYLARNIGSVFSESPLLIFLDDDAIPAPNFVTAHIEEHSRYEAIMVRGICLPKTKSPMNAKAKHYYLGDNVFPRFSDLEGNMSVSAEAFFKTGGWDDNIKFGHGGIELSYRLLLNYPHPQLMLYSPLPVIRHDYTQTEEALVWKQHKQAVSWRYLQSRHAEIDNFLPLWNREWSKLPSVEKGSEAELVASGNFASASETVKVVNPEYESMLRLAKRYADKGSMEKAAQYEERARQIKAAETAEDSPAAMPVEPKELTQEQLLALADLLALGEYDQVLASRNASHPQLASLLTAASLRMGNLELAKNLIDSAPDTNEMRLKHKALELLPKLAEPLSGKPRVHLIILCHNRENELTQAFRELAKTDYDNYAVYIADNGSTDGTWERLQEAVKLFPPHIPVEIERLPTNIGRPAGHNWLLTKYDHSESDYIAIGDDDLVLVPDSWLTDMLKTAELFPNAAAIGGKSLDPGLPPVIHAGVRNIEKFEAYELNMSNSGPALDLGQFDFIDLVDHVIGCLHIYDTKRFLNEVGLFDISLSPCQCVDIEHHLRTKTLGYDIVFNGFIQFQHMRAMGKSVARNKALSGNSLGNVVKILSKYDQEEVARVLAADRAKREAWLKPQTDTEVVDIDRDSSKRSIILIAFKYPPYAGVGTFRWAKFSQNLAMQGHAVHVVTVDWVQNGQDTYAGEFSHPNLIVHRIPSGFPHNEMHTRDPSIEAQTKRAYAHALLQNVSFDNEAALWGEHLLPYCKKLIQSEKIEVVIATGPPFHANVWAARLKTICPDIKLIQDFRDTWLYMPGKKITSGQFEQLSIWQKEAVDAADMVTVVSPTMVKMMDADAPSPNYVVLRNAFDPRVAQQAATKTRKPTQGPLTFCYLGSLGSGRLEVMALFLDAIRMNGPSSDGPKVNIFSSNGGALNQMYPDLVATGQLNVMNPIAPVEALAQAHAADYGITVRTDEFKQSLQTKMYDYISVNTPCISIGNESDEVDFIQEFDCGISAPPDPVYLSILLKKLSLRQQKFTFNKVHTLGADQVSQTLSNMIEEL